MASMNTPEAGDQGMHWLNLPLCQRYAAAIFSTAFTRVSCLDGPRGQAVHWALGCLRDGDWELLGAWSQTDTGSALPADVFADLEARGVESVRLALGGDLAHAGAGAVAGVEGRRRAAAFGMNQMQSVEQALAGIVAQVPPRHRGAVARALRAVAAVGNSEAVDAAMTSLERGRWGLHYPEIAVQWRWTLAHWAPLFARSAPLRRVVLSGDQTADKLHGSLVRAIGRRGGFDSPAQALNFVASTLSRAERRLERVRTGAKTQSRPCRSGSAALPAASGCLSL